MIQQPLDKAPATFKSMDAKFKEFPNTKFSIQIAPEDCTGCALCVEACPAKDKTQVGRKAINMASATTSPRARERVNWEFFLSLPVRRPHQRQPPSCQEFPASGTVV